MHRGALPDGRASATHRDTTGSPAGGQGCQRPVRTSPRTSANHCSHPGSEVFCQQPMTESLDAVDAKDRYLITVTRTQLIVSFDIDLFQSVEISASGFAHLCFHFFTEVTSRL